MKLVTLGIILICCNNWAMKTSVYGSLIEGALDKLRSKLRKGDEKLGFPALDPFKKDRLAIDLTENITLNANLSKILVYGLSAYDIVHAELDINNTNLLTIHLSWPMVAAETNYDLKAKLDRFHIYGNGDIHMAAKYLALLTNIEFELDGGLLGYLKITDINLKLLLKKLHFNATGLYNDEDMSKIYSAMFSGVAPELISNDSVVKVITTFIRQKLDPFLASTKFIDLLEILL